MEFGTFLLFLILAVAAIAFVMYLLANSKVASAKLWGKPTGVHTDVVYCGEDPAHRSLDCYKKLWLENSNCKDRSIEEGWGSPRFSWQQQLNWADAQTLTKVTQDMADNENCKQVRKVHF